MKIVSRESMLRIGTLVTTSITMSTPMLVNDWKDPHRTLLTIIAPEKPIDQTEADEIFRFVTEKAAR